jgi:hypothetical protein
MRLKKTDGLEYFSRTQESEYFTRVFVFLLKMRCPPRNHAKSFSHFLFIKKIAVSEYYHFSISNLKLYTMYGKRLNYITFWEMVLFICLFVLMCSNTTKMGTTKPKHHYFFFLVFDLFCLLTQTTEQIILAIWCNW